MTPDDKRLIARAKEPTISARAVVPMLAGLRAHGVDPGAFLRDLDLQESLALDPEARLPIAKLDAMWHEAAVRARDDDFGLHTAGGVEAEHFGIVSLLALSSPTWGDGLARVCRFFKIFSDASSYRLEREGPIASITAEQRVLGPAPVRHRVEFTIGTVFRYSKAHVIEPWRAVEVFFEHQAPADTRAHARFFDAPLRFAAGESGFRVPAATLASPLRARDTELACALDRLATKLLEDARAPLSIATLVEEKLARKGSFVESSMSEIARSLSMSARTLQRKLAAEGTSFRDVCDVTRHKTALYLLRQGELSTSEIAFALGFSEPAAFHRAFRRWTGQTPQAYRRLRPSP